jgi:hypothetical protein
MRNTVEITCTDTFLICFLTTTTAAAAATSTATTVTSPLVLVGDFLLKIFTFL